uniref:Uncharacterized protein n=1 Tax=Aegilops tauschii subsp. strangulata TaxID=200361 RepID=A0A453EGZ8_AEGTS
MLLAVEERGSFSVQWKVENSPVDLNFSICMAYRKLAIIHADM